MTYHEFNPDHNLFCRDCGEGELSGDHGMVPGPDGYPISTSDQFFDAALRPELVKLEAEAVMQDLAAAIPVGDTSDDDRQAEAELLARLRKEAATVRTDLAALERTAREIEQLERMMLTDEE